MEPVRKIGKSYCALRAKHPSAKMGRLIQLESALERDFCCLLEFRPDVLSFTEQPVTIDYQLDGKTHRYTPDFFVQCVDEQPATLVEIKYRVDLRANWPQLKPKFKAAKHYAAAKGWEFIVQTEVEIQTPYLRNAKFLLQYKNPHSPVRSECRQLLLEIMAQLDESTPEEMLLVAFQDAEHQAELLPVLWHLISRGIIGCNLLQPLTMQSQLWSLHCPSTLLTHA